MLSQKVEDYIREHSFCPEYLFKDWNSFLDILYSEGWHVSSIIWREHCRKKMQHLPIDDDKYSDPDDPEYTYAETQFFEEGFEAMSLDEIKKHIEETRASGLILNDKYFCFDLVPSFNLGE